MMKSTPYLTLILLCSASLHAASCLAPSNLVANCGLETGDLSNWTLSGTDSAAGYNGIDYGVDNVDAHSGLFGAYLGGDGGVLYLSQTLATSPGQTYNVSFWLAQSPAPATPYVNSVSSTFGSVPLLSLTQVGLQNFGQYSFKAVADSSAATLTFGFQDDLGFFSLDDISVTPAVSSTPELSTGWTLSLTLLLVTSLNVALRTTKALKSAQ